MLNPYLAVNESHYENLARQQAYDNYIGIFEKTPPITANNELNSEYDKTDDSTSCRIDFSDSDE